MADWAVMAQTPPRLVRDRCHDLIRTNQYTVMKIYYRNGVPYKDGMIAYYGNRIRSRCRGIQYEEIFE